MKYNKEKVKKFQPGGKTPQQIMAEARANQAEWRAQQAQISDAIAKDAEETARRDRLSQIQVPAATPSLGTVTNKFNSDINSLDNLSFGQAFSKARQSGLKTFKYKGKLYTTEIADSGNNQSGSDKYFTPVGGWEEWKNIRNIILQQPVDNTSSNTSAETSTESKSKSSTKNTKTTTGIVNTNNKKSVPNSYLTPPNGWGARQNIWYYFGLVPPPPSNYSEKTPNTYFIPTNTYMPSNDVAASNNFYQKGTNWESRINKNWINSYKKGGSIPRLNIIQAILGMRPDNKVQLNSEEYGYSYRRPWGDAIYSEIVKKIPYGNGTLTSQRKIVNPLTPKADTIYTMPSGDRVTSPEDLARYKYKFKLLDSLASKKQEGGTIDMNDESEDREQLIVNFAAELLKASGLNEEDIVDDEGNIKEEYAGFLVDAISEVDSPEFWEEFKKSPTTVVEEYIKSKTPEKVEYAKKGMKLKQLKSKKNRKCKCGCDLVLKKEAGGTIVEVCSCGCKNK